MCLEGKYLLLQVSWQRLNPLPTSGWTYLQWRSDLLPSCIAWMVFWDYAMLFWIAEAHLQKQYFGHC